jgi:hypothetical protein
MATYYYEVVVTREYRSSFTVEADYEEQAEELAEKLAAKFAAEIPETPVIGDHWSETTNIEVEEGG